MCVCVCVCVYVCVLCLAALFACVFVLRESLCCPNGVIYEMRGFVNQVFCVNWVLLCLRVFVLCVFSGLASGVVYGPAWFWSPWMVGDVGISGRLEQWLHNVFALMIPTVCSSYQPRCTTFHDCRWYEITHALLPYNPPSIRPTPTTPPHQSERGGTGAEWANKPSGRECKGERWTCTVGN